MTRRVGVLVVHGMGSQRPESFAAEFIAGVHARLATRGCAPGQVAIGTGWWAGLLDPAQLTLARRMREAWKFAGVNAQVRDFVVHAVGDVAAYRAAPNSPASVYHRVHDRIAASLGALRDRVGPEAALVIVAHSLGSVICSDHIWDLQVGHRQGSDPFTRGETLAGMVTFGSTLPLFAMTCEPVIPIRFPARGLDPALQSAARWINVFDRTDVLGYPLRQTSDGYEATVDVDLELSVGPLWKRWVGLSHAEYWASGAFQEQVAELIARIAHA
ncbi:MAG: hypothetical protein K2X99_12705 [Gemmatimonadaceae bacterium]|nr:hypothetical protein [Gemmatimonadaceae bacterium]